MQDLQQQLFSEGVALGMCDKFREEWGEPNMADLCHKFHRGLDFCIEHDWPSLATLRSVAHESCCYGIFTDDGGVIRKHRNVVLNGSCDITLVASLAHDVTVRHNSVLRLIVERDAFVYVSMHDDSKLIIEQKGEGARICVSHFSGTIENPELIDKLNEKKKEG